MSRNCQGILVSPKCMNPEIYTVCICHFSRNSGLQNFSTFTIFSLMFWVPLQYLEPFHITKTCLICLFKYIEKLTSKNWKFSDKKLRYFFFYISAQKHRCGYLLEPPRQGGSNEYPQSMFLSRNKKNNVYPCKPQFYYINVRFTGVYIIFLTT